MEENRFDKIEGGVPSPKIKTSEKFENFWYYYKWHVLVGIGILFVIAICTVQIFTRTSYDAHIIYAGQYEIKRTSENNDTPMYSTMVSSLQRLVGDINEDGETLVSFKDLFIMLSEDEIREIEKNSDGREGVNTALVQQNLQSFGDLIINTYDKYYISFVSTELYDTYKEIDGVRVFDDLSPYTEGIEGVEFYDSSAVYLSSTAASSLPGFSSLPEDTLIVIKAVSGAARYWNEEDSTSAHDDAVEIFWRILNYK